MHYMNMGIIIMELLQSNFQPLTVYNIWNVCIWDECCREKKGKKVSKWNCKF